MYFNFSKSASMALVWRNIKFHPVWKIVAVAAITVGWLRAASTPTETGSARVARMLRTVAMQGLYAIYFAL